MLNLKPKQVWGFFEEISEIPRCSGHEAEIRDYLTRVGEENDLRVKVDGTGNVLLSKGGVEEEPTAIVQTHMDMVCEKNFGVEHDFERDPIEIKLEDDWVTAQGTTLGADNGIGMALALAIATSDLKVGPMDFLFTVDEERGLVGANKLNPDLIRGDRLINLDSEEFGTFTVGCAGGGDTTIRLPVNRAPRGFNQAAKVSISGLSGGHSGEDIDKGRANAVKLLGRVLEGVRREIDLNLLEISGGDKHNAIPREAAAYIALSAPSDAYAEVVEGYQTVFQKEYSSAEDNLRVEFVELSWGEVHEVITEEPSAKIVGLLRALPFGIVRREQEEPELVETSTNLASIEETSKGVEIVSFTRSSLESQLENTRDRIELICDKFGAEVEQGETYPSWAPNYDSDLLAEATSTFKETYSQEPEVTTIHGGLETGVLGEKVEGLDMIAMGPNIESPHSPDERVEVSSVEKFWNFLVTFLESLD